MCEPVAEDLAWWWGGDVCCDAAGCEPLFDRTCAAQTERFGCDYARIDTFGQAILRLLDCPG